MTQLTAAKIASEFDKHINGLVGVGKVDARKVWLVQACINQNHLAEMLDIREPHDGAHQHKKR